MADATNEHIDLPPAHGLIGHLRYSYAGIRRLLQWRRQYAEIDAALRVAVQRRDETLAALGEATLVGEDVGARFGGFAQTLTALEAEYVAATTESEQVEIELAAAEAERREVLAAHDARIDALRDELGALTRQVEGQQRAVAELERAQASQADAEKNLEQRLVRIDEKGAGLDPEADAEAIASLTEERHAITARVAEMADEKRIRAARISEARAPLEGLRRTLDAQADALDAERESRQVARQGADQQVEELRTRARELGARARELGGRRRAALVDLGREALRSDEALPDGPRTRAKAALTDINRLRRQREALDARRHAFDPAPIRRTGLVVVAALFGSLLIWAMV